MFLRRATAVLVPLFLPALLAGGCGNADTAVVNVFSTHHGTPIDGSFPQFGDANMPRTFEHGDWDVTLLESYVTISNVTLYACDGTPFPINMFRGPCPENFRRADLETITVGGLEAPEGSYCSIEITYGPYEMPDPEDETIQEPHEVPDEDSPMIGKSIYLRGGANVEGVADPVTFEVDLREDVVVQIDLSSFEGDGAPLRLDGSDAFPDELTIAKTYDRFLIAADWSDFDPSPIQDGLADTLELETRVFRGQVIDASWFEQFD